MLTPIAAFLFALLAGIGLTPFVIRLAGIWGLFDAPHGDRRVHTQPLPRIGGVAVFAAMGIGLLGSLSIALGWGGVAGPSASLLFGILFGGAIIFGTGLLDDLRGLRPLPKVALQLSAAVIVYLHGFQIEAVQVGSFHAELGWFALPITLLWIVGVTNAFNLIDGLDGLASGIALVALAVTMVLALASANIEILLVTLALMGALIGFLRYNFNPARIFLGDSGSLFLGFMLSILSAAAAQYDGRAVLVIIPLFALAIPLLDTTLSILRRWLRGVPLSQADSRHIHHRLLALGLSHRHAVFVLYIVAGGIALLGLSLVFASAPAVISVALAGGGTVAVVLLYGLRRLQYHEFGEARAVITSGVLWIRQAIRNQINAQDLAQSIRAAHTREEVSAALEDSAPTFGFLHMEVCKENATGTRPLVLFNGHAARAWKLDYPVTPHDFTEGEDYVLRIWCNPQAGKRTYGAERVARTLAPAVEEWFVERGRARLAAELPQVMSIGEAALRIDDSELVPEQGRLPSRPARRPATWAVENGGR